MQLNDKQNIAEGSRRGEDLKETGRVEAFSDGVFAVAITLLVLNIHGPDPARPLPSEADLMTLLLSQWPTYLAFVTSFATIGVMWVNHHRLFTHIKRTNTVLMMLNLLLLLIVVFVPFPTSLLALYIEHPEDHVAALLYSGTFIALAICFSLLWGYTSRRSQLLDRNVDQEAVQAITRQYRFGPLFYLVTFILALIYVPASVVLNLLLALFFALPSRSLDLLSRKESGDRPL